MKAYQYTSITSVMLLDCWSIPCVMLFTWLFLKTKYRFLKITGVLVCLAGLVLVVFSDVHAGDRAGWWLIISEIDPDILCMSKHQHKTDTFRKIEFGVQYLCSSNLFLCMLILSFVISKVYLSPYGNCLIVYAHATGGSNPRIGDILVIAGATLYAVSNVSEVN